MAGSTRWAVVGLACLLVVLGLTPSVVEAIRLEVEYPQTGNYSYVTLTCIMNAIDGLLNPNQQPATFWRGTSQITSGGSQLVAVMAETDVSISFVFNQDQEGSFTCRTALNEVSNVEKLAGRVVIQYWQYCSCYKKIKNPANLKRHNYRDGIKRKGDKIGMEYMKHEQI